MTGTSQQTCSCPSTRTAWRQWGRISATTPSWGSKMEKAHKAVDLKYLRQINRMAVRIFHDAVLEHPTKETAARTKLHIILQNNEVSKILRGAVDDADDELIAQPWRIPAVQIWSKICHKYEGMTDMLTGTMMEELDNIITCVTGDARQRRTIHEADQDFERFGKTLIANFNDSATLWSFLRASLRQCHIHKLSNVGKDKAAWEKADEYLTNLMDSAKQNEKECNYCKKTCKWFQGHDESECLHKKKDEAEAGLLAIKERRERAVKGRQATKGEKKAFEAGDDQHSEVSTSLPVTSPHPVVLSATATLDQRRVRHGTVDTAAQLHVCEGARGKGERILLKGITGDTVNADRADLVFPVTTIEGKRYAIFMRNQTLVVDKETETLLSVAVLLKAGFDVKFVTGTKRDPSFGGYLVTTDGQKIRMIFGDNLWRLPMCSDPVRYTNDQASPTNRNTLALVPTAAALEALAQPSLPDQDAVVISRAFFLFFPCNHIINIKKNIFLFPVK
jgi:hypothetical protein